MVFYPPGISTSSVNTSGDEIKFTLKIRVNVCDQKNVKLFLSDFNESNCCTFRVVSQTDLLKVCFTKSGIDTFSIPMHCSSYAKAWE